MTRSFAARLERFSYDKSAYCVLLIEAAMAKPAEESHGEALRRDSAFRRMVQFCGPGGTADAGLLAGATRRCAQPYYDGGRDARRRALGSEWLAAREGRCS